MGRQEQGQTGRYSTLGRWREAKGPGDRREMEGVSLALSCQPAALGKGKGLYLRAIGAEQSLPALRIGEVCTSLGMKGAWPTRGASRGRSGAGQALPWVPATTTC